MALGTPEVAHNDALAALIDNLPNSREGRTNTVIVADLAVLDRDVEVDTEEDYFVVHRPDVIDTLFEDEAGLWR